MGDPDEAGLTLLDGGPAIDDEGLRALYAYPAGRCVARANAIASLDGAATTGGLSGGLGGAGDSRVFALLRELADVIVVGAGTARIENYGGARMSAAQRARRQARGQPESPPIALVTRTGLIEPDMRVLADSEARPLVLTCAAAVDDARDRVGRAAEVVDCSGADPRAVDLAVLLARLAGRGLPRMLTEGGPSLLGAFAARRLLDELCLTSAPVLVGGGAVRIASGGLEALTAMRRAHVLADAEGFLYARYTRVG